MRKGVELLLMTKKRPTFKASVGERERRAQVKGPGGRRLAQAVGLLCRGEEGAGPRAVRH